MVADCGVSHHKYLSKYICHTENETIYKQYHTRSRFRFLFWVASTKIIVNDRYSFVVVVVVHVLIWRYITHCIIRTHTARAHVRFGIISYNEIKRCFTLKSNRMEFLNASGSFVLFHFVFFLKFVSFISFRSWCRCLSISFFLPPHFIVIV